MSAAAALAADSAFLTSKLCSRARLVELHPTVLTQNRVLWSVRNRHRNGLASTGAVLETQAKELLIHETRFLAWYLNLGGKSKPRKARQPRRAMQQ